MMFRWNPSIDFGDSITLVGTDTIGADELAQREKLCVQKSRAPPGRVKPTAENREEGDAKETQADGGAER